MATLKDIVTEKPKEKEKSIFELYQTASQDLENKVDWEKQNPYSNENYKFQNNVIDSKQFGKDFEEDDNLKKTYDGYVSGRYEELSKNFKNLNNDEYLSKVSEYKNKSSEIEKKYENQYAEIEKSQKEHDKEEEQRKNFSNQYDVKYSKEKNEYENFNKQIDERAKEKEEAIKQLNLRGYNFDPQTKKVTDKDGKEVIISQKEVEENKKSNFSKAAPFLISALVIAIFATIVATANKKEKNDKEKNSEKTEDKNKENKKDKNNDKEKNVEKDVPELNSKELETLKRALTKEDKNKLANLNEKDLEKIIKDNFKNSKEIIEDKSLTSQILNEAKKIGKENDKEKNTKKDKEK